jgi:hypothetical protein
MRKRKKIDIENKPKQDSLFRFRCNAELKESLLMLSSEKNVKASQLVRDVVTEYVANNKVTRNVKPSKNQINMFRE